MSMRTVLMMLTTTMWMMLVLVVMLPKEWLGVTISGFSARSVFTAPSLYHLAVSWCFRRLCRFVEFRTFQSPVHSPGLAGCPSMSDLIA